MFCPSCSMKLLLLAMGFGKVEPEETVNQDLRYYVCRKCRKLLMKHEHGKGGYHFKILGSITDESLALLIADGIKGENP